MPTSAYEPVEVPEYIEFTIDLGARPAHKPPLTKREAASMLEAGIRFSIYRPATGEFAVSFPYVTILDTVRRRLTFRQ
ncbi:hypothetical protein [Devosia nitrariae]|nr:hypothetical protein [Devosia nitrariae]